MQLTDEQKQLVSGWVKTGCGLSEIQKRLSDELGVAMTYMDVRFLVLDLGLEIADRPSATPEAPPPLARDTEREAPDVDDGADGPGTGDVRVTVDRIMKPGALASGSVTFSDGVSGSWTLDQFGRLGLDTGAPGYRPSQDDLMGFQAELQHVIARRGL